MSACCSRWTGLLAEVQERGRATFAASRRPAMEHRSNRSTRKLTIVAAAQASSKEAGDGQPLPPTEPATAVRPVPRAPLFQQKIAQAFDARAPTYEEGNSYHPAHAARVVELAALQPGERVLDVGCGTGLVTLPAARAVGPSGKVTGVDLSDGMIHQAAMKAEEQGLSNLRLLAADIEQCDFSEGRFDAILCSNAVPFLTDIPAGLAMLRRWLRPGGRLVFNAPRGFASRAFKVLTDLLAKRGLRLDDPSVLFEDEDSVRGMLAAAGFASVEISASEEVARRLGRTPEDWAASGWKQSRGLPFADLDAVLDEEAVEQLRLEYLAEAEAMVRQFATPEGDIAEPFHMLWVVARAPE
ncbi:hypothetical protein ABPG77_010085 [Micractinium sp. CCAP 211/92]